MDGCTSTARVFPGLLPPGHVVALTEVAVDFECHDSERRIRVEASASAKEVTGVGMEEMTACAVSCVTLGDMVKGADRGADNGPVRFLEKTGGKSGRYER